MQLLSVVTVVLVFFENGKIFPIACQYFTSGILGINNSLVYIYFSKLYSISLREKVAAPTNFQVLIQLLIQEIDIILAVTNPI